MGSLGLKATGAPAQTRGRASAGTARRGWTAQKPPPSTAAQARPKNPRAWAVPGWGCLRLGRGPDLLFRGRACGCRIFVRAGQAVCRYSDHFGREPVSHERGRREPTVDTTRLHPRPSHGRCHPPAQQCVLYRLITGRSLGSWVPGIASCVVRGHFADHSRNLGTYTVLLARRERRPGDNPTGSPLERRFVLSGRR